MQMFSNFLCGLTGFAAMAQLTIQALVKLAVRMEPGLPGLKAELYCQENSGNRENVTRCFRTKIVDGRQCISETNDSPMTRHVVRETLLGAAAGGPASISEGRWALETATGECLRRRGGPVGRPSGQLRGTLRHLRPRSS
ncbi:hypothetical protein CAUPRSCDRAFT_10241 [Caulochytrium protostelioides]|uniref:Uncharacterized protein n=1 Tax=Caulochytrium protostelioides TaxID=1555241 RepID=A0A4P9X284_9FUNG|nr:hypothetical protein CAUPRSCDRAFT_10241 [Caulochytrium protostelioides]